MFRLLIKLAILALIVHGAWRVGSAYMRFYRFEDALQELAQFGERRGDRQLCDQAAEAASQLGVAIPADGLKIRRSSNPAFNCGSGFEGPVTTAPNVATSRIFIEAEYTEQIEILPGYRYPWTFKPNVNAWIRP